MFLHSLLSQELWKTEGLWLHGSFEVQQADPCHFGLALVFANERGGLWFFSASSHNYCM